MAKECIFTGNGIDIYRANDGRLFVEYEYGMAASWMVQDEITKEEAERAQRSAADADAVVLAAQRRGKTKRVDDIIFDKFGVMLFYNSNTDRYGIRYDEGGVAGEVTAAEAEKLQRSEVDALEVVAACERRAQ